MLAVITVNAVYNFFVSLSFLERISGYHTVDLKLPWKICPHVLVHASLQIVRLEVSALDYRVTVQFLSLIMKARNVAVYDNSLKFQCISNFSTPLNIAGQETDLPRLSFPKAKRYELFEFVNAYVYISKLSG